MLSRLGHFLSDEFDGTLAGVNYLNKPEGTNKLAAAIATSDAMHVQFVEHTGVGIAR
jgi:hypothetical protein